MLCEEKAGGNPYQTCYPVSVIPKQINELQDALGHVQTGLCLSRNRRARLVPECHIPRLAAPLCFITPLYSGVTSKLFLLDP